ncbi:MAG: hypothetical protein JXR97_02155 [Planctomycetes bacterium]|nr:hypothetical protein [Planctomycetota bacterium]
MECPCCGSRWVQKDYAPARTYALMLLGIALIVPRNFINPEMLSVIGQAHVGRVFIFGIALLFYGMLDAFRHGNRYCGACGYRFRAYRENAGGGSQQRTRAECAPFESGMASSGREDRKLDPNTPIEPLLKCLNFKNEKMRSDAAGTLRRLTGQDFGTDAEAWSAWWAENKDEYAAKRDA